MDQSGHAPDTRQAAPDSARPVWHFDAGECRLTSDGGTAELTPKAAAVLGYLMDHQGRIVSREDLLQAIWPGLHVTPDLVRAYIFDLRAALGDDARAPRYIETVKRQGFRFLGGVARADPRPPDPSRPQTRRQPGPLRATVAVLGPQCDAAGADLATFANSLADDIINEIGRYEDVGIVARAISFAVDPAGDLRESASDIGADYLLESSLARWETVLRARFRLVDGRSGRVVWSERFERDLTDPLRASDEIMQEVTNALVGWHGAIHRSEYKIVAGRDVSKLTAFEHFIRGCDIDLRLDAAGVRRSLSHLTRSLELDDRYARCWLIKGAMLRWGFDVLPEASPALLVEADEAIDRAYLLDPDDAATLALLALRRSRAQNAAGAEEAARSAEALAGADADAWIATATALALVCGDFDAAGTALENAFRFNPVPPGFYHIVETRVSFFMGNHARAIEASHTGTEHVSALGFRALSHAMRDEASHVRDTWADISARFPRFRLADYARNFPIAHPAARARFDAAVAKLNRCLR